MGPLPKNLLFGSVLLFSLQNSFALSPSKFHFDIQESIHSHVLQDIAYDTYIDLIDSQSFAKSFLPNTEEIDVISGNAEETKKHLILLYAPSKGEWVKIPHKVFGLNPTNCPLTHRQEIPLCFSDLYEFKLRNIKVAPLAPITTTLNADEAMLPHLERLAHFAHLKGKSNIALILSKLMEAKQNAVKIESSPRVEFISQDANEKNTLDPKISVMEQLKPFEQIKTKQYEHTPPMLRDFFAIYSPGEEEASDKTSLASSVIQITLETLKNDPLQKKLPFFPVTLFDERIDDVHAPEPTALAKAPRLTLLSSIDLPQSEVNAKDSINYFNRKELKGDNSNPDKQAFSSKEPPLSYAIAFSKQALPQIPSSFPLTQLQKEQVGRSPSYLAFDPPKHISQESTLSPLEMELNLISLDQREDVLLAAKKEISPKDEKRDSVEFKNLQLLQAIQFLNPHKSQKRSFSMEALKVHRPLLVINTPILEHANLQAAKCIELEPPTSSLSFSPLLDIAAPSFGEIALASREVIPPQMHLEKRLHFFHQEKYTELGTDKALEVLHAEDIAAHFKAPDKIDFYQSEEETSLEKPRIEIQNNPLHTLSFIHKVKKPTSTKPYPVDFTKPYTYQFNLSEEPHKKDLLHSVEMWKTNLPAYKGSFSDYIDLLAQNEEGYNPHLAHLIESPAVDVRPLIALGEEINRQRRQMVDQLTFVPTLFELSTQILTTEFKTDVEVIAKPNAKGYYFALKVSPFFPEELKRIKQNIYFVIDGSRTITKERIKAFKKSILRALPYLYPDDAYNILCFDKGFEKLSSINCYYSKENSEKTKRFLDNISESSLSPPQDYSKVLSYISENFETDPSEINVVILMTDGAAYKAHHMQHEKVINFTRANHNQFIVYTVTSSQNNYLSGLDLISFLNKGQMLHSTTNAALPRQVALLVKKLRYPIATDLHLTTLSSTTDKLKFYPGSNYFENLYGHKPLVIYGESDTLGEFEFMLQGKCDDEWINITQSVNLMQALPGDRELLRDATQMETKSKHYIYKEIQ